MTVLEKVNAKLEKFNETIFAFCTISIAISLLILIVAGIADAVAYFVHHICWR